MRKIILAALDEVTVDNIVTQQMAEQMADEIATALDAAGYVIRKKPAVRKVAAPVEVFNPNTGDSKLDDFMRRKHGARKVLPDPKIKASQGLPALRPLKVSEATMMEADWVVETRASEYHVVAGNPSEAEKVLHELVALHRNPWVRARAEGETGYSKARRHVFTSERHPHIEIHEVVPYTGGTTFEVYLDGVKVMHRELFRVTDAEQLADATRDSALVN